MQIIKEDNNFFATFPQKLIVSFSTHWDQNLYEVAIGYFRPYDFTYTKPFQIFVKGGFFSESVIRLSNLHEKYSKKTILSLKFKFPAYNSLLLLAGN